MLLKNSTRSRPQGRNADKPSKWREPSTLPEVPGANVVSSRLSTDDRWIAYQSDQTGKYEVYVSPFPSTVTTGETPAPLSLVINWAAEVKK